MDDYLGISPKTSNEFKVTETGELERAVRPFSRNIRIDEFDKGKQFVCSTTIPEAWQKLLEKGDQKVTKYG